MREEVKHLSRQEMRRDDWHWQMSHRITELDALKDFWPGYEPTDAQRRVAQRYPFAITPYYLSLVETPDESDAIFRMAFPHALEEEETQTLFRDPLAEEEEAHNPRPGLLHRYPDRVVLLVNGLCPVYCRHCTRKRFVGIEKGAASEIQIEGWASYLRENPQIKDVILSGGDPLTLSDSRLERILSAIRAVPSVEIIRIGTRIPVLMPMRVTPALCNLLDRYHPLWLVTHFNHPREVTPEAAKAADRLLRAGVPVQNQSVLLRGINDHPDTLEDLSRALLKARIRPYYLHQSDLVFGIEHLRTPVSKGIEIMEALRGRIGGLGIPLYVIDLPQGGGKVPVLPQYLLSQSPRTTVFRNFEGRIVAYPEPSQKAEPPDSSASNPRARGGLSDLLSGVSSQPLVPRRSSKKA